MTKKEKRQFIDLKHVGWRKVKSLPNMFFNLEKRNYEKKTIPQIKLNNGQKTTDPQLIQKEIESYFSGLYKTKICDSARPQQTEALQNFVETLDLPKLSEEEQTNLEHELTLEEINRVWKGILGIRDLTKIRCGIRENEKYLDGIRDLTATGEAGFAKIWARDVGFCCLSVGNSGKRHEPTKRYSGKSESTRRAQNINQKSQSTS